MAEPASMRDRLGRPAGVLRLSLTARCNLACPYCCPDSQEPPELLSLAERLQLVAAAVDLGFGTLRLTGGEPLLNRDLEALIARLQALRDPRGRPSGPLQDIALTTNGALLGAERARALKAAGLDRITISLDGSDGESVARMAGLLAGPSAGEALLAKVLAAVEHAGWASETIAHRGRFSHHNLIWFAAGYQAWRGSVRIGCSWRPVGRQVRVAQLQWVQRHRAEALGLIQPAQQAAASLAGERFSGLA